jgi:predicted DNA binding CopG/RHH family protein
MRSYVKNEKGYSKVKFDAKAIKDAYAKTKSKKKHPTSINLPVEVVTELKALALEMDIPYQTLMRKMIVDALAKLKAA